MFNFKCERSIMDFCHLFSFLRQGLAMFVLLAIIKYYGHGHAYHAALCFLNIVEH